MDTEPMQSQPEESSTVYIIGAIVVVAVIVAGVILWPKKAAAPKEAATPVVEQKKMITKLTCDKQWYNPKVGFNQFYLSAQGTALSSAKSVECTYTFTGITDKKVLLVEKLAATLSDTPDQGGQTYTCITKAVDVPRGIPVTMLTSVTDDIGGTASCTAGTIQFP